MSEKISIVVTDHYKPSIIRITLGSILKNSHFKHHEIVFVGDRIWEPCDPDFIVEPYKTEEQYIEEYWIPRFEEAGFTFKLYKGDWNREELDKQNQILVDANVVCLPAYECWSYGVDRVRNKWVRINGGQTYSAPDWDLNITKHFFEYARDKFIFQPVWGFLSYTDDHAGKAGWSYFPVSSSWRKRNRLRESQLIKHFNEHKVNGVVIEDAARRQELSFFNAVVHMDVIDQVRQLTVNHQMFDWRREPNYNGGDFPEALDLKFDLHCAMLGVKKLGCLDSFVYMLTWFRGSLSRLDSFVADVGGW